MSVGAYRAICHQLGRPSGGLRVAPVVVAVLFLLSGVAASVELRSGALPGAFVAFGTTAGPGSFSSETGQLTAPRVAISDAVSDRPLAGSVDLGASTSGAQTVYLSLRIPDRAAFVSWLSHHPSGSPEAALAGQDLARFSPDPAAYSALVGYLSASGVRSLTTYPDRLAVTFTATPAVIHVIFGTRLDRFEAHGISYTAPTASPTLPRPLAALVESVDGLGTGPWTLAHPSVRPSPPTAAVGTLRSLPLGIRSAVGCGASGSYPCPVVATSGAQFLFPTDLQVAYDEESLLSLYGNPTTVNVAALLWGGSYGGINRTTTCGNLTQGQAVGPYDPSDFSAFFNQATPVGEPHPTVSSVVVSGAAAGCLSSWDTSGVVLSNTAQLEALGSTLPGATVWAVSVGAPTVANLLAALQTVISPPSSLGSTVVAALQSVGVVDAGWLFPDQSDAAWSSELLVAQSRGLTIVCPTGDSGGSTASSAWLGTPVAFPASDATNTSGGSLAVGGTTLTLNAATLHIATETSWYNTTNGSPALTRGSSGGTSTIYPETTWQSASPASSVLAGAGRGVPDLAAVANNTLGVAAVNGGVPSVTPVAGTGIAAAVVAGLLAEVDHVLASVGAPQLGFPDPTLYHVAGEEYTGLPNGSPHGHYQGNSTYASSLPTLPFHDVVAGHNAVDSALPGYDLVTGWGSLDAYNYTMYVLPVPTTPQWGRLQAVEDFVNLTSLSATSSYAGGTPPPSTGASLQLNLFIANAMGAPVYWIQSVTTLSWNSVNRTWNTQFQGWIVLPFWGLYPDLAVYEFWLPPQVSESLPLSLSLEVALLPGNALVSPQVEFGFGVAGAPVIEMPVPGAAYILGAENHTYNWQGTSYTNGPNGSNATGVAGFLAPQFSVVGLPGGATANFLAPTAGNVEAYVEPASGSSFIRAGTGLVRPTNTQTGESASNLSYTKTALNGYSFAYAAGTGKAVQGIYQFEEPRFAVRFVQSGAAAHSTWYVNVTGRQTAQASAPAVVGTIQLLLPNGTYNWTGAIDVRGWSSIPPSGTLTVAGLPRTINLTFGPSASSVVFQVYGAGLPSPLPFSWTLAITGGPTVTGPGPRLNASLPYGTYGYHASLSNTSWQFVQAIGSFVVSTPNLLVYVKVRLVTYVCELAFELPGGISPHMTVQIGSRTSSGYYSIFSVRVPNGTHSWSVTNLDRGDSASPASGQFVVHGPGPGPQGKYVAVVQITAPSNPGFLGLGSWGYVLVGGLGAAAALLVVLVLWRRRRGRGDLDGELGGSEPSGRAPLDEEP